MARDFKLNFRFGSGVLGSSAGNVALLGANVTSFTASHAGLTGTDAPTGNTVSNQLISCPLAWGGYTQTAAGVGAPYAEDVPNLGSVLPGHTSRNDMFCIVDLVVATTLTTAQQYVVQASDNLVNWVTVGVGETTLPGTAVSNTTITVSVTASTSYNVLTASAAHGLLPGDLVVVATATNITVNNGHETPTVAAGNVFEVASVPSTTTFTLRYPGPVGATLKSNYLPLNNIVSVSAGATPAFTLTRCQTSGVSLGAQIMIPLAATSRPYIRLAAFGGGGATGFAVIRDAYLAIARTGATR